MSGLGAILAADKPVLGVVAAISLGASDFLAAKTARHAGSVLGGVVTSGAAMAICAAMVLFPPGVPEPPPPGGLGYCLSGSALMGLGSVAFFAGLKQGPVTVVSPLSSTYPIITTVVGVTLFGAPLTAAQLVSIAALTIGVLLAGGLLNHPTQSPGRRIGPPLGVLTALLWGLGYPLISQGMMLVGWKRGTFLEFTVITMVFAAIAVAGRFGTGQLAWRAMRSPAVIACGAAQVLGVAALNVALEDGAGQNSVLIATALSATYPTLTVLLALRHFRERVSPTELVGALTSVTAVIALTLFS